MEQTMTTDEAIRHFGSKAKLAAALGILPHGIYKWGERPPILRQYQIQCLTEGLLKADDKR
jgi:transcriptional repressor of cell division inhibition gene dicB